MTETTQELFVSYYFNAVVKITDSNIMKLCGYGNKIIPAKSPKRIKDSDIILIKNAIRKEIITRITSDHENCKIETIEPVILNIQSTVI